MTTLLFANDANTTLAGSISNTATNANLASGTGALFPNPAAGQAFKGTFNDAATGLLTEIVLVTAISGDTITMVRAQEGTVAQAWNANDLFANLMTSGTATAFLQQGQFSPARIVTASGAFTITTADAHGSVGLNRLTSLATSSATLPSGAAAGDTYTIEDLAGNFNAYAVTISYPAGMAGPEGAASQVLDVNKQSSIFRFYGSNQWGFKL